MNRYNSAYWNDGKLLGSAPSLSAVIKLIEKFWYASPGDIEVKGEQVFQKGKKMDGVRVVSKGGRYRFEMI